MASQAAVLTGSAELNAKLATLKSAKAKQAIRKASRAALRPVAAEAKSNAPRRTGQLAKSVKVRSLRRSRSRVGSQVTASGTLYGAPQEYGWRAGRRASNADVGAAFGQKRTRRQQRAAKKINNARRQIPGTEFMKRAVDSKKAVSLQIYKTETARWITALSK